MSVRRGARFPAAELLTSMPSARDPRSVARLVEMYPTAQRAIARRFPTLPRADREDVLHEAVANVLVRLDRGPLDDPGPYLLRVAVMEGVRAHRRRSREGISLDGMAERHVNVDRHVDPSVRPLSAEELTLARADAREVWCVLLEELTPEERLVLVRRGVDGRTPDAIAAELGISARRYRRLLERAGRKLNDGVERVRAGVADGSPDTPGERAQALSESASPVEPADAPPAQPSTFGAAGPLVADDRGGDRSAWLAA